MFTTVAPGLHDGLDARARGTPGRRGRRPRRRTRRPRRSAWRTPRSGSARSTHSSSVMRSLSRRWLGETPMPVWMRGRFAVASASAARSMSFSTARVRPQTTQSSPASRPISWTEAEVAGARDGEARLDDVNAHADELLRDDELLLGVHGGAGTARRRAGWCQRCESSWSYELPFSLSRCMVCSRAPWGWSARRASVSLARAG